MPSLRLEREARVVVGLDEVGRGALAGPVAVGAVAITDTCGRPPVGIRDSKELSAQHRAALAPRIERWSSAAAVGWASAGEVDAMGLTAALRCAAIRALGRLRLGMIDAVLLDGSHDYLGSGELMVAESVVHVGEVRTGIRADSRWTSVAAASVIAKHARDTHMAALAQVEPRYGGTTNKGYAAVAHRRALQKYGPSSEHRLSWRLPTPVSAWDDPDVAAGRLCPSDPSRR